MLIAKLGWSLFVKALKGHRVHGQCAEKYKVLFAKQGTEECYLTVFPAKFTMQLQYEFRSSAYMINVRVIRSLHDA